MKGFWSQPLRVECTEYVQLITSRTVNSALWFVNSKQLEQQILGYLAKYVEKYHVKLFAFSLVGNHYHILARFPHGNRSQFFRDFNARIAEAVRHNVPEFIGGPLFERRFTPQMLPLDEDVENYFYYAALQAVDAGLCERISDYDSYNSFHDAAHGITRKHSIFRAGEYRAAKRHNPSVSKKDFIDTYELKYERLPGFENETKLEYAKGRLKELERRRIELVKERKAKKKAFLGTKILRGIRPGTIPLNTKKGDMRPLVLSVSIEAKNQVLSWYFAVVEDYRRAVEAYRRGEFAVDFPPGTFRPPGLCIEVI